MTFGKRVAGSGCAGILEEGRREARGETPAWAGVPAAVANVLGVSLVMGKPVAARILRRAPAALQTRPLA